MGEVVGGLPVSKRERIVYLLGHWEDVFSLPVSSGLGGGGGGTPHLSGMASHRSVVELGRCLAVLKVVAPRQHDHLMAYHSAEWRVVTDVVRRKRKGGRFESVEVRRRERIVPRWVRMQKVRLGEEFLVARFRGQVDIPLELWEALTLSIEEVAVREARRRARAAA